MGELRMEIVITNYALTRSSAIGRAHDRRNEN